MTTILTDVSILHAILERAPGIIVHTDMDMNILYLNRVEHGFQMEDAIGASYRDLLAPQQLTKVDKAFARAEQTGETQGVEFFIDPPSGGRQWYSTTVSLLRGDGEAPQGFVCMTTEVTARKAAEMELQRTQRELMEASHRAGMAEVVTGVLHNVGNVLNSVGVSVASVARTLESSRVSVLPRVAKLLEDNGERLGEFVTDDPRGRKIPALIKQLGDELMGEHERMEADVARLSERLDLMRATVDAQQGVAKASERVEEVEPRVLIERTLSMFRIKLEHCAVEVSVSGGRGLKIVLDPQSTIQILANLIINAIEALEGVDDRPRRLAVRVSEHEGHVEFEVEDNGVGLSPDLLTKAFEHGFTTKAGGHGFGLHSSVVAARSMGGSLVADSEGPGRGALFRLSLPRSIS